MTKLECPELLRIYKEINGETLGGKTLNKTKNYLGHGVYSTTILYNGFAYKIYRIVCEGEENGFSSKQHINELLKEVGWQKIASIRNTINNIKLSPDIYNYFICEDTNKCDDDINIRYFIIKMEYLKNYINVDDVDVSVLKNPYFIMSMNRLLKEKEDRNIPAISDGSRTLSNLHSHNQLISYGVQAMVNKEKIYNKDDDCVFLIDFGNVMDYKDIMQSILSKYNENPTDIPTDDPYIANNSYIVKNTTKRPKFKHGEGIKIKIKKRRNANTRRNTNTRRHTKNRRDTKRRRAEKLSLRRLRTR